MKGYIVGYFESWADDRNDVIIGYFMSWTKMLKAVKTVEKINVEKYAGQRAVYVVEIEPNKMYNVKHSYNWTIDYPHYRVETEYGKTYLRGCDKEIVIDIYTKK